MIMGKLRTIRKHPAQIAFIAFIVLFLTAMLFLSSKDTDRNLGWVDEPTRGAILTLICLIISYLSVRTGLKNGSTFYRLADVNLIFPSPLTNKSVLFYGFTRQLGIALLVLLWLAFQAVNLY